MKQPVINKDKQGKHYEVDIRNIKPLEHAGGNLREDYGDLDELAASIEQNGILTPLRAMRDLENEGKWFAIEGHRRLAACIKLLEEKNIAIRVKVIVEDARYVSDEELIYQMITMNNGKPLTFPEQAEAVRRLIVLGITNKEIAKRFAKPASYISNLSSLAAAPAKIKKMISDKRISFHLAMEILHNTKDYEEAIAQIEATLSAAAERKAKKVKVKNLKLDLDADADDETEEKEVKATKKDLEKATGNINSYDALKRAMKAAEKGGWMKNDKNVELFKFCQKIHTGKFTQEELQKLLFLAD